MELSKNEVKPGQNVNLKVSSKVFSTVSIFGIDSGLKYKYKYKYKFKLSTQQIFISASKLLRSGNTFSKTDVIYDIKNSYHLPGYSISNNDIKLFEVRQIEANFE